MNSVEMRVSDNWWAKPLNSLEMQVSDNWWLKPLNSVEMQVSDNGWPKPQIKNKNATLISWEINFEWFV